MLIGYCSKEDILELRTYGVSEYIELNLAAADILHLSHNIANCRAWWLCIEDLLVEQEKMPILKDELLDLASSLFYQKRHWNKHFLLQVDELVRAFSVNKLVAEYKEALQRGVVYNTEWIGDANAMVCEYFADGRIFFCNSRVPLGFS